MAASTQTRKRFWTRQISNPNTTPQPTPATSPTTTDPTSLWSEALGAYKDDIGVDLRDDSTALGKRLASCTSVDDIDSALQDTVKNFGDRRKGKKATHTVRESLKSIITGLKGFLDIGAEVASASAVPGGKGIFVALGILLQAAERATARFDSLEKLFQQFQTYLTRLNVRMEGKMGGEARSLVVNALVCMLKAFMLATKMMREGRIERFLKALSTKTSDVHVIITELQDIVVEEERLAVAEIVVGLHELSINSCDTRIAVNLVREDILASRRLSNARFDRLERLVEVNQTLTSPKDAPSSILPRADDDVCLRQAANELYSFLSMFSPDDRVTVQRALAFIYSLAVNAVTYSDGNTMDLVLATCFKPLQVLATFVPWAFAFVSLFAIWRCISRPLGVTPGRIVLIDVLGKTYILEDDTFLSWEKTHAFLIDNFTGRHGLDYVIKRDYVLEDADTGAALVDSGTWSNFVRPGMTLEMGVIVRQRLLVCPWCESTLTNYVDAAGRTECANRPCRRTFSAYEEREFVGVDRYTRGSISDTGTKQDSPALEESQMAEESLLDKVTLDKVTPVPKKVAYPFLSLLNQRAPLSNIRIEWVFVDSLGEGSKTAPIWIARSIVGGEEWGSGRGSTKKAAKNAAAKVVLRRLGYVIH